MVFLASVAIWVIAIIYSGFREMSILLYLAAAIFSLLAAWLAGKSLDLHRKLVQSTVHNRAEEQRLRSVIQLNRQLVEVEDDIPVLSQYGLRGMREKADFQFVSRPGQGNVIHLRLPARSWEVLR
ncbi:MAG: hypothetical protein Q7U74_06420 [Saprospiraceae bacterium]|nr:hypothetical protein [Saprospiraceae bacterium]